MRKNIYLTYIAIILSLTIWNANTVFAQSELDLLMEEKKNETSTQQATNTPDKANKSKKSLSEKILPINKKNDQDDTSKIDSQEKETESETWLESLFSKGKEELFQSNDAAAEKEEARRLEQVLQNRRSNAANFDISGIRLRMSPKEVEETLTKQGYHKIIETMEIPNFIKWRSEELCRINGVTGFERLNICTLRVAKENGFQFIEHQMYNRSLSNETLDVHYTSTFTDNLAHFIYYKSNIPFSTSHSSKNIYLNNLKVFDFWQRIDQKYGMPDNVSEIKWGLGGKKPYLKATTGTLELVDPLLKSLDTARMINEDTRISNTQYYTF